MTTGSRRPERSTGSFDFGRLAEISDGDPDFERDILTDFIAQTDTQAAEIDRALEAGDGAALSRAAHTLKGASRTVGAEALGSLAAEIEALAARGDVTAAYDVVARTHAEWECTRAALTLHLDRDGSREAA